jgi:hypothetical protein
MMSSHYTALRDGNQTTMPAGYLPKSHPPAAFRLCQANAASELDSAGP